MIGRVVKGKYKIYDELGAGGFATVYLGRNMDTNEIVAIKVLSQQYTREPRYVERFRREARLAERLRHPNIVRVLDHGVEDGLHFLVMEFVEGLTLNEVIARKGRLSVEEAISYTEQICAGLQAACQAGVVHRDIKPANLMITPGGRVKIMDFGIARMESQAGLTQSGMFMGTPRYISPEMARGAETDIRSDLYAVGLVLYEMLTGRPAFDAENSWAVLRLQLESDPPPISQMRPDVPLWLEAIVFRAIAKDPARRFQMPVEMLAALQSQTAIPAGVTTAAVPLPQSDATLVAPALKARRAPTGLIIGLAGVAALVVVALVIFLLGGKQGQGTPTPEATQVVVVAPSDTPTVAPTNTPLIIVVTSTPTDTETPSPTPPATDTPLPTETLRPTATEAPQPTDTPAPEPTAIPPTPTATSPVKPTAGSEGGGSRPASPGPITDLEQFGTWKRGDQPNGTFTQSSEQVHSGSYAGKLAYNFSSADSDFVVFLQTHRLGGRPNQIGAWVYGDGSKHYLNVWVRDAAGETWQFPLGQVKHTGWQQMVAWLDPAAPWPAGHIEGPANGVMEYPLDFRGLVLDDIPDSFIGSGVIYVDDLRCAEAEAPPPVATPAPTGQAGLPQPTAAPLPTIGGRIAFSAGGMLHIVNAATGQDTVAPIPNMRQPDFRADGQLIIANGEGGGRDSLWTIDARTGGFVREQSPFTNDFRPFWSPDGTQIVYDSLHQGMGNYILYKNVLDSKRDEFLAVGSMAVIGTSPVWMHDDWIAFTGCDYWLPSERGGGSKCGIYRMPSWGGQPALVKSGDLTMRATDNHGGQLLFMSQESGNWEVYIIPSQGGTARNLSDSPSSQDGLGTFSPDGRLVAFVSNRGGGWAVWVVKPDGSAPTKLFNLPAPLTGTWTEEHISWGP